MSSRPARSDRCDVRSDDSRAHRARGGHGYGRLHLAGADSRAAGRHAKRHLHLRCGALRDARGQTGLHGRHHRRVPGRDSARSPARSVPERPRCLAVAFDRLVARCLEKNPDERFQSARDLAYALRETAYPRVRIGGLADGASRAALVQTPLDLRCGSPAFAAFAAGWLLRPGSARRSAPPIDRVTRLTFGPGRNFGAAISPDGKWFAYVSDAGGQTDVWVKFVAGGEAVNLTGKSGLAVAVRPEIGGLDISPDGSLIAFGAAPSRDANITEFTTWVVPAPLGGTPRRLVQRGMGARWSPDGKRIAYVSPGGGGGDALLTSDGDGANDEGAPAHRIPPSRARLVLRRAVSVLPEMRRQLQPGAGGAVADSVGWRRRRTRRRHLAPRRLPGAPAGWPRRALLRGPRLAPSSLCGGSRVPAESPCA